jgi:hypothetical protein
VTGFAAGLAVMLAGFGLFVLGWTVLVIGHRRWAQAAGVSFWRLAFVYGQERTDVRLGNPFEAGFRYWRAAFAPTPLADADADAARTLVRRGAILCGTGWATSGLGWLLAAVVLAE